MIDKMISILLTIVVIIVLGIILYTSVFAGVTGEQTAERHKYELEYGELLIHSLLLSHDNESLLTYDSLLAQSMEELSPTIGVNGVTVDVPARFSYVLDAMLGRENYYMTVEPVRKGVAVTYVLDGSPTMAAKRQQINADIPALTASLQQTFGPSAAIFINVYLLTDNRSMCSEFSQAVDCKVLSGEDMYNALMSKSFKPPYPEPYRSYPEWALATHVANVQHMAESDWASAAAYASYAYQKDAAMRSQTNKQVIVVVVDELSSSSKADSCFTITKPTDFIFCFLCNATCPVNRSAQVVGSAKSVLTTNGDALIAFQSVVWDYSYDSNLDSYNLTRYSCRFIDQPRCSGLVDGNDPTKPVSLYNPPANVNWCSQVACGGCDLPSSPPAHEGSGYGYHRNCDANVSAQLQLLATPDANGDPMVFPLNDQSLSQLTGRVADYVNSSMMSYQFTVGVRNESRDRYVFAKDVALADGHEMTVNLWIYDSQ